MNDTDAGLGAVCLTCLAQARSQSLRTASDSLHPVKTRKYWCCPRITGCECVPTVCITRLWLSVVYCRSTVLLESETTTPQSLKQQRHKESETATPQGLREQGVPALPGKPTPTACISRPTRSAPSERFGY